MGCRELDKSVIAHKKEITHKHPYGMLGLRAW